MKRNHIYFALKILFSVGLIGVILYLVDWREAVGLIADANPFWLVVAGFLVVGVVLLDGLRLSWMIPMPELSTSVHLRLALQSAFVLQLGFGIAAGDAYRTARYAARSGKVMKPVVHIIAARLAGIASIAIVVLAISVWVLFFENGSAQELGVRIIKILALAFLAACGVFAAAILFAKTRKHGVPVWYVSIGDAFGTITPRVWALSLFMVIIRGVGFACALYAIGQFVPIHIPVMASNTAALTTLAPFAFGGLGIREGALAGTVALFGFPFAAALSAAIVMRIVVIVASCAGLLVSYLIPVGNTGKLVGQLARDGVSK